MLIMSPPVCAEHGEVSYGVCQGTFAFVLFDNQIGASVQVWGPATFRENVS